MSNIYDNWKRLVEAVLKREEIWKLCHAPSRSPSLSSISSDFSSSSSFHSDDMNLLRSAEAEVEESAYPKEIEWVDVYEAGVYLTLVVSIDGSIKVKRIRFSRERFNKYEAEAWWQENKDKIYEKYNDQVSLNLPSDELSRSTMAEVERSINQRETEWVEHEYEPGVYLTLVASIDGSIEVKRIRFSRERFKKHEAQAWWLKNWDKVYATCNV